MEQRRAALLPAAVAGLTVLAFGLRLADMGQNLYGDEFFTFYAVDGRSLADVVAAVRTGYEDNPPLFYVLAWASSKLGETWLWIRLPSLLLGTALIPVIYLAGARLRNPWTGMVAAALASISPFMIFYGTEGRAYAQLMFLSALSLLLLLRCVERDSTGRWAFYALSICALLYTHYTAALVPLAQAVWVAWRHRTQLRPFALAAAAALAGYSPWLVTELTKDPRFTDLVPDLSAEYVSNNLARVLPGHPFHNLSDLPGRPAALVFGIAVLAGAALVARAIATPGGDRGRDLDALALLVLMAVAVPIALVAYSLGDHNIFLPRNLGAAAPAGLLLVAWALTAIPRAAAVPLCVLALGALAVGAAETVGDEDVRGTGAHEAARYIDANAGAADPVVLPTGFGGYRSPLAAGISVYFERPHPVSHLGKDDAAAWRAIHGRNEAFVVTGTELGVLAPPPERQGPGRCYRLVRGATFASARVAVGGYRLPRGAALCTRLAAGGAGIARTGVRLSHDRHPVIEDWFGHDLPVGTSGSGSVDAATEEGGTLVTSGWAADTGTGRPADWVLVFSGGRLVGAAVTSVYRLDLVQQFGKPGLARSGFRIVIPPGWARTLRMPDVVAVLGDRAYEVPVAARARRALG
jgi:hypothetical protein